MSVFENLFYSIKKMTNIFFKMKEMILFDLLPLSRVAVVMTQSLFHWVFPSEKQSWWKLLYFGISASNLVTLSLINCSCFCPDSFAVALQWKINIYSVDNIIKDT